MQIPQLIPPANGNLNPVEGSQISPASGSQGEFAAILSAADPRPAGELEESGETSPNPELDLQPEEDAYLAVLWQELAASLESSPVPQGPGSQEISGDETANPPAESSPAVPDLILEPEMQQPAIQAETPDPKTETAIQLPPGMEAVTAEEQPELLDLLKASQESGREVEKTSPGPISKPASQSGLKPQVSNGQEQPVLDPQSDAGEGKIETFPSGKSSEPVEGHNAPKPETAQSRNPETGSGLSPKKMEGKNPPAESSAARKMAPEFEAIPGQEIQTEVPIRSGESSRTDPAPQIQRALQEMIETRQTQLNMRLQPENLGSIRISLVQSDEGLQVAIQADTQQTAQLLEQNLSDLRHALQRSGIDLADLFVGQGKRQDQGRSQPENPRRKPDPEGLEAVQVESTPGSWSGESSLLEYRI